MTRTRTFIVAAAILAVLAGAGWLIPGDSTLAQDTGPPDGLPQSRSAAESATRPGDARPFTNSAPPDAALSSNEQPTDNSRRDGATARPSRTFDLKYAIIYEKNIFLRDRATYFAAGREPRVESPGPAMAPRRPEESYVVTGIALQEGRHVAFIENTDTRETTRVLDGEAVANGKVVSLDVDALEFELAGKRMRIPVGRNLAGEVVFTAPAPAPAVAAASPTASTTRPGSVPAPGAPAGGLPGAPPGPPALAGAPLDPNNANLSIEERMKLKRSQSGGK